jgi:hypothetical protein
MKRTSCTWPDSTRATGGVAMTTMSVSVSSATSCICVYNSAAAPSVLVTSIVVSPSASSRMTMVDCGCMPSASAERLLNVPQRTNRKRRKG